MYSVLGKNITIWKHYNGLRFIEIVAKILSDSDLHIMDSANMRMEKISKLVVTSNALANLQTDIRQVIKYNL